MSTNEPERKTLKCALCPWSTHHPILGPALLGLHVAMKHVTLDEQVLRKDPNGRGGEHQHNQ